MKNTYSLILFGLIAILMFTIGLVKKLNKANELDDCSRIIKATIYKKTRSKGTRHNYYEFTINNVLYNKRFVSSWDLEIGDEIFVRYSCSNPEISEELSTKEHMFILKSEIHLLPDSIQKRIIKSF